LSDYHGVADRDGDSDSGFSIPALRSRFSSPFSSRFCSFFSFFVNFSLAEAEGLDATLDVGDDASVEACELDGEGIGTIRRG
jgi:hypothetical protein